MDSSYKNQIIGGLVNGSGKNAIFISDESSDYNESFKNAAQALFFVNLRYLKRLTMIKFRQAAMMAY